jgi:hypothetical protein
LSPSAISYGNIVDEAALNPVKVVVSNNDDNAIELVSVEYPDKPFLISNIPQLPYVIKANSSFEFNVHIQDVAEGFKADSVVFTYSKGKSYVPLDVLKISPTFSDDEDADNSEYITIYPNPFGDSFIIDINRDYTEATIKIYDSNSRIVYNQRFDSQNSIKLSGLNISPGIYIVEIIIDGKVFKKIVIKV